MDLRYLELLQGERQKRANTLIVVTPCLADLSRAVSDSPTHRSWVCIRFN